MTTTKPTPVHPSTTRCASCGAEVIWTVTAKGRRMPVERGEGGNVAIETTADGVVHATIVADGTGAHVSHFATCPQANRWRGSKR